MTLRSRLRFAAVAAPLAAVLALTPAYSQQARHDAQTAGPPSTAAASPSAVPSPVKVAETKAAADQVVANAKQIAGSIEPYYGKAASDTLLSLLVGHYGAIKQYLEATAASDQAKQAAAVRSLNANADEIAAFLSGANPNLPRDTVRSLILAHGAHHVQQIQQLSAKQYAQEAQTWEAMTKHMYVTADMLAGAIARQFPAKFA